jgi:hypothetical protein
MKSLRGIALSMLAVTGLAASAQGQTIVFSTNKPDLKMGVAARPEAENAVEIEPADDFVLASDTRLTGVNLVGLVPAGTPWCNITRVTVQLYRVFPLDSDTTRTARVPTRANSPADVAFVSRDSLEGRLSFQVVPQPAGVTAQNSVVNGINPVPNQKTGGEGAAAGDEFGLDVTFDAIDLPAGHYFFVPQVEVIGGGFLWLSSPKPIVAPGTPFTGDLQAWVRSGRLSPDWLRVGTDIVGGDVPPTFNMSYQLKGAKLCYPNCDDSTATPVLNVLDFNCFINRFVAGASYANCDGSTAAPALNVLDFNCFLNRFSAGCQ